jgi:hypothetical protein
MVVEVLRQAGYDARHVAQEHSYVLTMWQRVSRPDVLVYLDVNYPAVKTRRPTGGFQPEHLEEQNRRLAHAREHCDLYLDTSTLAPDEVQKRVLEFLQDLSDPQPKSSDQ